MNIFDKNLTEWTLFLDRDGVINRQIKGDYVRNLSQLEFLSGSIDAAARLSKRFGRVIVITNQRGVARGLMSLQDVENIHKFICEEVEKAGGRIEKVYFCPHDYSDNCNCRKPATGMIDQAKADFPEIDLNKCLMVGDSKLDMELAINAGIRSVFIGADSPNGEPVFPSLAEFADELDK